jgi:arginyl-tRNA synthetase
MLYDRAVSRVSGGFEGQPESRAVKEELAQLIAASLASMDTRPIGDVRARIQVERTRDPRHGDFSSNVALVLAKELGLPPRALAERIVAGLPASSLVSAVEIAGPGFINLRLRRDAALAVIDRILDAGPAYGCARIGVGRRVQVEFVSANPTGPLHVGHGRGAAYGSVLANLLEAVGYGVEREYYVNDAGRQVDILALSVWLRYLEDCGLVVPFPAHGYQGDYVRDLARDLYAASGARFQRAGSEVTAGLPGVPHAGSEAEIDAAEETLLDALIANARRLLGSDFSMLQRRALERQLAGIRAVLERFRVRFDRWFSEQSLYDDGKLGAAIDALTANGHLYEKDGALWFRATEFGDTKDRVVLRENGAPTYFAADIAYHHDKFRRGYDEVIDVWGADHHGYFPRVRAALAALGHDPRRFMVPVMQLVALYRGGEPVRMGKRSGSFVTLEELFEEVGVDATRFFFVLRKADQHFDFDLDLAKAQTADNPVYYVQYAHARICSVFAQARGHGWEWDRARGSANLVRLDTPHEQGLVTTLARYPELIEHAAINREPHLLAHYLYDLAHEFHGYYNAHKFIVDDAQLRDARLNLIAAVRQVVANGLALLGVSAPETM